MTKKQKAILLSHHSGKSVADICKQLNISKQNLYTTRWRMLKKGINLDMPNKSLPLSPAQHAVLACYRDGVPIEDIAKRMQITCQTVWNHAAEGFKRLGLTRKGEDRIKALKLVLNTVEPEPLEQPPITLACPPITLDDPFFN